MKLVLQGLMQSLGKRTKGFSRAWEGVMSLLDVELLRDLLNSVSSAHAQTSRKVTENLKRNIKTN